MRAVIQRVNHAYVKRENEVISEIKKGFLIYLGIEKDDSKSDIDYITKKIVGLRIFSDASDKMNLSIKDISGEILIVSQFTLYGDARKGNRPSFSHSATSDKGRLFYKTVIENLKNEGVSVKEGEFQSHMEVYSLNDGPATILLDSRKIF